MARRLYVPRDGSMIFGMLIALFGIILLPYVFILALAQSGDNVSPLTTLKSVGRPVAAGIERLRRRLGQ